MSVLGLGPDALAQALEGGLCTLAITEGYSPWTWHSHSICVFP